jgi:OmpA-OmpF porin, OOP family
MRKHLAFAALACLAALAVADVADVADAQSMRERLRQRAQDQVERRIEQRADEVVERGMERTEQAIRYVIGDAECVRRASAEGRDVVYTDGEGNLVDPPETAEGSASPGAGPRVGEGAWANYDFVPGERVLFAEDLRSERTGNFPRRLQFVAGNLEIVDWQGTPLLRSTAESGFTVPLPEMLPERFTLEFDLHTRSFLGGAVVITEPQARMYDVNTYRGGSLMVFGRRSGISGSVAGQVGSEALTNTPQLQESLVPVRILVDGSYVKVFLDEQRVANVPNAMINRSQGVQIWLKGTETDPSFIGNIRVAVGGTALHDALEADGRVSTQGILFETGSDRIRPESTPTIREIGEMLRRHADLRLRIEGHTDGTGSAEANQRLSERRALAVKQHLVDDFGIDAARLEAVGKGQGEPAESNNTPEGRQHNRRVVLVRL